MDFEPNEEQRAIDEAVDALLERHAGVARAAELGVRGAYDHELAKELAASGFLATADAEGAGPLEAARVVEAVARAAGVVSAAAEALVAPAWLGRAVAGPVALVDAQCPGPVRYGAVARTCLVLDGSHARVIEVADGSVETVSSWYGYPFGRVDPSRLPEGELLRDAGPRLRAWWQVAVAVECAGTLAGALAATLDHVKVRRQFGRAIGSFQAVQHRLAECHVRIEGCRWLAYEAAAAGAPDEAAAAAAAHAVEAAAHVFHEAHQLSGAIGYTREHPLHAFSMRLQALRLELGGAREHRRAVARARWAVA